MRIKADPANPSKVTVAGSFKDSKARRNLSFVQSIAGADGLGKRFSDIALADAAGKPIGHRKLQDGEFLAEADFASWKYTIDLTPPAANSALAHVSWLGPEHGLLMTADLLPIAGRERGSAMLFLDLPAGWDALSGERRNAAGALEILDVDSAVIFVGKGLETASNSGAKDAFAADVAIAGKWQFTAADALGMAGPILKEYRRIFPKGDFVNVRINVVPFPRETQFGTWQAETRGRTVTIVSSDMAFRTQSLQRLHEQLRHELFHLWIPNALSLTGGYDWFYEGFALYQSLKTGVAVNRISFGDMLSTLSRAYAIDRRQTRRTSMIDASQNRWNAGSTELYARGMLIAFAADVAMMNAKRRSSVSDIFRAVYEKHSRPAAAADGNEAVLAVMNSRPELAAIAERYIKGSEAFDLAPTLAAAGLILEGDALKAVEKPGSRQKAILDSLGYNNWRRTKKYQNEK